ncbi:MAG TPA: hypothetical protein VD813_05695 [Pseudonocardia sp.]|nr:hypothetical protein [Pseudonocardia sp.]
MSDANRPDADWDEHTHEATVHDHEHWHVTHHWKDGEQTFEHLASRHSHEHDHASITHAHAPHEDVDHEHAGEAHVHDHDTPVDPTAGAARGSSA